MGKARKNYEINMLSGPIMPNILRFALPIILAQTLQLLFNAADMMVLGQFAKDSDNCLAAVGSTTSVINLLISVFTGVTVGANIVIANYRGAAKPKDVSEAVHTSILTAIIGGILLMCLGIGIAEPILHAMKTPKEVFDQAVLYVRIYFIGIPFQLIYNFGAAVLRSVGDTKRPMYFLTLSGVINNTCTRSLGAKFKTFENCFVILVIIGCFTNQFPIGSFFCSLFLLFKGVFEVVIQGFNRIMFRRSGLLFGRLEINVDDITFV